jgi:hypothetical protein
MVILYFSLNCVYNCYKWYDVHVDIFVYLSVLPVVLKHSKLMPGRTDRSVSEWMDISTDEYMKELPCAI